MKKQKSLYDKISKKIDLGIRTEYYCKTIDRVYYADKKTVSSIERSVFRAVSEHVYISVSNCITEMTRQRK